ncbi:MAG: hypothetical protein M3O70_15015 [Actinomycetota bacterium]|nr:hypothetical protein [Actinomycetota bacterium]
MDTLISPRLVLGPLWGHSAFRLLAAHGRGHEWRWLRAIVLAEFDYRCAACSHRQRRWMVCDEGWQYDPDVPVAVLLALRLLCPRCDAVCHVGHTGVSRGPQAYDRAISHMARVNGTSIRDALEMVDREWQRWRELSAIVGWRVRVAADLAARFPALSIVERDDLDSAATSRGTPRTINRGAAQVHVLPEHP